MIRKAWEMIPIREIITKSEDVADILPTSTYKQVTVRLWGKGVTLRKQIPGIDIAGGRWFMARTGQFILSRIDARNGAFGIIPDDLDGAVVSNDFPIYDINTRRVLPGFLNWTSKTRKFIDLCESVSEGTTNRVRLKEERFYNATLPLPDIEEQRKIITQIDFLATKLEKAHQLKQEIKQDANALLCSAFSKIIEGSPLQKMDTVAPLVRRKVEVKMGKKYPELGIKCFGKGTFHKPALDYLRVGTKKLYHIEPGDLLFSNVFAWEGAIAVSRPEDKGRLGSHRFITCLPKPGIATSDFLCFYFLTQEGLSKIGEASPGGAGRNRTLGIKKLTQIEVPVPEYSKQLWFNCLQEKICELLAIQHESDNDLDALLLSILDRTFKGKLRANA